MQMHTARRSTKMIITVDLLSWLEPRGKHSEAKNPEFPHLIITLHRVKCAVYQLYNIASLATASECDNTIFSAASQPNSHTVP